MHNFLNIPEAFLKKIDECAHPSIRGIVEILIENNLYFFEEYTDHGIRHLNSVLKASNDIIEEKTHDIMTKNDVTYLVLSILLHDIGMHIGLSHFKSMIYNYKEVFFKELDQFTWSDLWQNYLIEAKKITENDKKKIFGNSDIEINVPDLKSNNLSNNDRKLIGEFIRRHHPRIAHEIAYKGVILNDKTINILTDDFNPKEKDLIGIIARSHGMDLRDSIEYLKSKYSGLWKQALRSTPVFLMVILRIADYFQIDSNRVLKVPYSTKAFSSPLSYKEHVKHLITDDVQFLHDNPEVLYVNTEPTNSEYFLAMQELLKSMQMELDTSWAVLGEVYGGFDFDKQPKLVCRRIQSNIFDKEYSETIDYVPELFKFKINDQLAKLLIQPLYGDIPTFGVREILQNSIDACALRRSMEKFEPNILIQYDFSTKVIKIQDNGIGMGILEIKNYFLKIGSSYRNSSNFRNAFMGPDTKEKVGYIGKFGIGILASYLLGDEIEVYTKNINNKYGYYFKLGLDTEFVNLEKRTDINQGTEIKIKLTDKVEDDLFNAKDLTKQAEYPYFSDWYIYDYPKIQYKFVDGKNTFESLKQKKIESYSNYGNIRIESIFSKDYGIIPKDKSWVKLDTYQDIDVRWNYLKNKQVIIVNGILIPDEIKSDCNIILYLPSVSILDHRGNFPLSLNRNEISGEIPFLKNLREHIFIDILGSIAKTGIRDINERYDSLVLFSHKALMPINNYISLFSKKGFSMSFLLEEGSLEWSDRFFYLIVDNKFDLQNTLKDLPDNVFLTFKAYRTHMKNGLVRKKNVENLSDDFVLFHKKDIYTILEIKKSKEPSVFHDEVIEKKDYYLINRVDKLILNLSQTNGVNSVIEIDKDLSFDKKNKYACIMEKFMGNNRVIPYDIKEREKTYPLLF